jgi:lipid II isoglutaminyl synthase (glutamine-hydrolysing)
MLVTSDLPARTRFAVAAARAAAAASRATGRGKGGVIGGRIALKLDPHALRRLARGRIVVLVTGTNGKTTTTLMLRRAIEALAPVVSNGDGANMPDGLLGALAADPDAPFAVLEVDETYLPWVAEQVRPAAIVLLNLSRDQLDRVGEIRRTERELRAAVAQLPETTVVANCDDVLVTSAAGAGNHQVWVGTGQTWRNDSVACPRCGRAVRHDPRLGTHWDCWCGLARPKPDWVLDGDCLSGPESPPERLDLNLPGRANAANAALALAAATCIGVPAGRALDRIRGITAVAGRYQRVPYDRHAVRVLLAKNPAGWHETLPVLEPDQPVVIAINAREADGRDPSWLWDVPFERLRGRRVIAAGERAADLAVRLRYAEVESSAQPDPLQAVASLREGPVELVANYTAFRDVNTRLGDAG